MKQHTNRGGRSVTMSTKHVTCRYFLHGVCREGSNCLFSHDLSRSSPSTVCKFYQRGVCAYGERCRYDHIKVSFRGGGATEEPAYGSRAMEESAYRGGTTGRGGRGGAKKTLVLRDMDGACAEAAGPVRSKITPPQSYVDAMRAGLPMTQPGAEVGGACAALLCPFAAAGHCYYGDTCTYLHGDLCEVCGLQVLHPTDAEQRRAHEKDCLQAFEADMERAFAAQLSQDKVCSVCMEVVVMKSSRSERRFGILSSCCHVFCLSCIRQWRCTKSFSNNIIKSCPECRVVSEFVIPSVYWVENQDEKNRLIEMFKAGVSKKPCKYFDGGRGTCPFGGNCLYLHILPDGTKAESQPMRKQQSSEGGVRLMHSVRLWDFIEERQQRSAPPPDDDIMELRELFLQMIGPSQDEAPPSSSPTPSPPSQ